jgi:hypothetical protein
MQISPGQVQFSEGIGLFAEEIFDVCEGGALLAGFGDQIFEETADEAVDGGVAVESDFAAGTNEIFVDGEG